MIWLSLKMSVEAHKICEKMKLKEEVNSNNKVEDYERRVVESPLSFLVRTYKGNEPGQQNFLDDGKRIPVKERGVG